MLIGIIQGIGMLILDLNSFIYAGYQITNWLKHLIYSPKKVAIIDLDNTIWGGVMVMMVLKIF